MLLHGFLHDESSIFRSNVSQFVNDKQTHPVVKYKAFIVVFLLVVSGLFILLLLNRDKILGHSFWRHLFIPVSELRDTRRTEDVFEYNYRDNLSDAAVFRQAIEGMTTTTTTTTKDGKTTNKNGEFVGADKESAEKKKKTPCATDCGQYVDLKGKINELSKYVSAVKNQKAEIKQTGDKLQELGKQVEDLNKSLSPGGQVKITM